MLTKTVTAEIDTEKARRVECPQCHHLVKETNMVPTVAGLVCVGCYEKTIGV